MYARWAPCVCSFCSMVVLHLFLVIYSQRSVTAITDWIGHSLGRERYTYLAAAWPSMATLQRVSTSDHSPTKSSGRAPADGDLRFLQSTASTLHHHSSMYDNCSWLLDRRPSPNAVSITRSLSPNAVKTVVQVFTMCWLDYCNSLLFGTTYDFFSYACHKP